MSPLIRICHMDFPSVRPLDCLFKYCMVYFWFEIKIDLYQVIKCAVAMTNIASEIHAIRAWTIFHILSWVNTLLREKLKIHRIKNIYHGYSIGRFKQKKNLRVILFLQYDVCYFINHVFLIGTPKGSFKLHEHLWLQCVCNSVSKYVTHSSVAVFSHVYKKSLKQTASYYHESK